MKFVVFCLTFFVCHQAFCQRPVDSVSADLANAWKRLSFNDGGSPTDDFHSWFEGFVAGRIGFDAPTWWLDKLSNAKQHDGDKLSFSPSEHASDLASVGNLSNGVQAIIKGSIEIALPIETMEKLVLDANRNGGADHLTFLKLDESRAFVCFFPDIGFSFNFHLVDLEDGQIIWTSKIVGGSRTAFSGQGFQEISILANDKIVVVWGVEPAKLFFEGFDVADGKKVFEFFDK